MPSVTCPDQQRQDSTMGICPPPDSAGSLIGVGRFRSSGYFPDAQSPADNHHVPKLENFRLKVFRAVADQLSFRRAAEQLFLTQPAVTLQVKTLEDELGVRLFDRAAGRI